MRIGIVTTWFERGAAYVSKQYRDLLRRHGHEVFIYARGGERYAQGNPIWDTPDVTWGQKTSLMVATSIDKKDFCQWMQKHILDIVIFNEQHWFPPVLWTREAGCKAVCYVDYYTEATVPYFALYDGLICNTKRHYSAFAWHPNCLYIPWGTDVTLFSPKECLAPRGNGPVFFHSSGLSPKRKGTDLVLQAFSRLVGPASLVLHMQNTTFTDIIEMRPLADDLVRQGRLQIYDEEVAAPGLYHLGDVYVYPSRLDGIGLTQVEALACGLPLIVPDNPPMNEFITLESGIAVPIERLWSRADGYYWPQCEVNLDALVKTMQTFIDDFASLGQRKEAARAYAEQCLDWLRNGKKLGDWLAALPRTSVSEKMLEAIHQKEMSTTLITYPRLRQYTVLWNLMKGTRDWLRRHC